MSLAATAASLRSAPRFGSSKPPTHGRIATMRFERDRTQNDPTRFEVPVSLRISGKNLDVGDAFRTHVESRIGEALAKYFDGGFTGHVTLEREGPGFKSDVAIHLDTGIVLQAEASAQDAHQSFDKAAERIEKRLRRYKRRLKEHHADKREATPAASYVIAAPDEEAEVEPENGPTIIAEGTTELRTMTVGAAVMAMDLGGLPLVVFRHAGHGGINVVYRRTDGHIGWIDPEFINKAESTGR
jgi:ribosomal subunit interface protein